MNPIRRLFFPVHAQRSRSGPAPLRVRLVHSRFDLVLECGGDDSVFPGCSRRALRIRRRTRRGPLSWGQGSVRSPWQAQAVPALAGRAGAIHLASTSHPSTVADHSPPSAAVETAAGSNAAARKVGKRPVLVPLGSGGIARWGRSNPISFLRIPKVIKSTLSLESIEHVPWRKLGHVGRDWRFINNYTNGSLVSATSQDHRSGQPGYQSRI